MIGRTLSHYQITEKPGKKWTDEVYRAKDRYMSHQPAFKILPPKFAHDAEWLESYNHEARNLLQRQLPQR